MPLGIGLGVSASFLLNTTGLAGPGGSTLYLDFASETYEVGASGADRSAVALASLPDYSFARPSAATYIDNSGVLSTFASGEPRIGDHGYLNETARTNLTQGSGGLTDEATNWFRVALDSVTSSGQPTWIDGSSSAFRIRSNTATSTHSLVTRGTANFSVGASADYTVSIFLYKQAVLSGYLGLSGGDASNRWYVVVNPTTGAITQSGADGTATHVNSTVEVVDSNWFRVSVTGQLASPTSEGRYRIVPLNTGTPSSGYPSFTGANEEIIVYGAQFELGSFPSSYIETANSSVTRAADVMSIGTSTDWADIANPHTIYVEVERPAQDTLTANEYIFEYDDGVDNDDRLFIAVAETVADDYVLRSSNAATGDGSINTGVTPTGNVDKVAASIATNDYAMSVNGNTVVTDNSVTIPGSPVDSFGIGSEAFSGGNGFNGYIHNITYYDSQLSDAAIEALTA